MMRALIFILVFSTMVAEAKTPVKKKAIKKRSTLLNWVKPGWVDTKVSGNKVSTVIVGEPIKIQGSIPKNSSGVATGTSFSSSSGGETLVFNDNAPKNGSGRSNTPPANRGGKPPKGDGGGDGGGGQAFDKWWPLCMFIDPSEGDVNDTVKGVVDMAANCGVNLVVWPITIKSNYPNSPDAINSMASNACNAISSGISEKASVTTCVKYADTAGIMCGDPPDKAPGTAGCAQMGGGGGGGGGADKGMLARMKSSGHFGGQAKDGQAVPSIERQGACTPTIVAHESQGHSQFGWPNGSAAGNGIGTPDEGNAGSGSGGASGGGGGGWSGIGCAQMRATGLPNDGRWKYNPKQTLYYVPQTDPEKQWDLTDSSRKLFPEGGSKGDQAPPPSSPPRFVKGDKKSQLSENFFTKNNSDGPAPVAAVDPDGRHRKLPNEALLSGVKSTPNAVSETKTASNASSPSAPEPPTKGPNLPPASAPGADGASLTFNDSVSKVSSSESSGPSRELSSVSSSGGGMGEGDSLTFDDSVAKGSNGASSSARRKKNPGDGAATAAKGSVDIMGISKKKSGMDDDFWAKLQAEKQSRGKRVKGATLRVAAPPRNTKAAAKIYTASDAESDSSDD